MIVALALAGLGALASAAPPAVVARAADEVVTAQDLRDALAAARSRGAEVPPEKVADQLVAQALLAIDARRSGLAAEPAVRRAVDRERRRAVAAQLEAREADPTLSEAELREAFHALSDAVDLDVVVLASEEEARAAAARLAAGAPLAGEAARSLDPEGRRRGGALGSRTRGQLDPALAAAAFDAPAGRFGGPVKLALGWATYRVRARRPADEARFAAEKEGLRRYLGEQARSHLRTRRLQALRAANPVEVDEAFLGSPAAAERTPAALDRVVARAGGGVVRHGELVEELDRMGGAGAGHGASGRVAAELARALADRLLLEDDAARRLAGDPAAEAAARAAERVALADAWVERARRALAGPSDGELERFYRERRREYAIPAARRCAQIVTGSREAADAVLERLGKGEGFEDLARRFSLDRATRGAGGVLGDVTDARLDALAATEPEVVARIRGARPGEPTAPARSAGGWHVFRCDARVPARERPLAEVREEIRARLAADRLEAAVAARVAALRLELPTQVDPDALRRASTPP